MKNSPLPHKNRAVYSNAFHDNRHVRLFWIITHVRLSLLLVAEASIKHYFFLSLMIVNLAYPIVFTRPNYCTWFVRKCCQTVLWTLLNQSHTPDQDDNCQGKSQHVNAFEHTRSRSREKHVMGEGIWWPGTGGQEGGRRGATPENEIRKSNNQGIKISKVALQPVLDIESEADIESEV